MAVGRTVNTGKQLLQLAVLREIRELILDYNLSPSEKDTIGLAIEN